MSMKRTAATDLNHDNWDEEDPAEHEEMGIFKTASKDVLEKRVIRTAKRRSQVSGDETKKSAFSGFGGFNKSQPASFDFLANLTNGSKNTNGAGTKSDTAVTSSLFSSKPTASSGVFGMPLSSTAKPAFGALQTSQFASTTKTEIPSMTFSSSKADSTVGDSPFKIQSVSSSGDSNAKSNAQVSSTIFGVSSTSPIQNKSPFTSTAFKQPASSTSTAVKNSAPIATESNTTKNEIAFDKETEIEKARNKYYSKLKGLNESVSSWIVKHVEKTPLCFLTPIFKDYENYLKEFQEEYEAAKQEIDVKAKPETSEIKTFGMGGTSLFSDKSSSSPQDDKTNAQPFGNTTPAETAGNTNTSNTGFFGTTSNASTTELSPTIIPKGFLLTSSSVTDTNSSFMTNAKNDGSISQGFSYGTKATPSATSTSSAFASTNTNFGSPPQGFSFGITSTATTSPINSPPNAANTGSPAKGFSFGISTPATNQLSTSTNSLSAIGAAPFSFGIGAGKPFSFSSQTQQQSTEAKNEEEDQPPKVEYTPVVEENSVFDKKCKIFVKKDGNFVDKGVGTLYVKKIEESGKHQLLARANTNLGTVLLNLILGSAVPTQRMGKNNVMLVCIPTPDAVPPPTPVLIRVKTSEEADELLKTLNKYKS